MDTLLGSRFNDFCEQARRTRAAIRDFINYVVEYVKGEDPGRVAEAFPS